MALKQCSISLVSHKVKMRSCDYNIFLITSCPDVLWNISNSSKCPDTPLLFPFRWGGGGSPCWVPTNLCLSSATDTLSHLGNSLDLSWLYFSSSEKWGNRMSCLRCCLALKRLSLVSLLSLAFWISCRGRILFSQTVICDLARSSKFISFGELSGSYITQIETLRSHPPCQPFDACERLI